MGFNGYFSYRFEAINVSSATELWHLNLGYQIFSSSPVVNGTLYMVYGAQVFAYVSPNIPTIPSVTVTPSSWTLDVGQSKTFTANPSGGSGTYPATGYQWYVGGVAQSGQTASTFSFTPASAGSYSITATVTDSSSTTSAQSNAAAVTVNSALVAPTVSASKSTVDQGQTSSLTSTAVSTGTSPYTYQWLMKAPGAGSYSLISGATSSSYSFVTSGSTTTGSWSFELQVTDSASTPVVVTSTAASVTVNVAPTVSVAPVGPLTLTVGQVQAFTATPSGGSGTINYQWYLDGAAVGSNSASYSYTAAGTSHSVTCKVTDSASTPVTSPASNAVSVTVNPTPTPAPTSSPTPTATPQPLTATATSSSGTSVTVTAGNSVTCTATVSGGTAPYHYQWEVYVSPNSTVNSYVTGQTSAKLNVSQTVPGTYTYFLLVFDANGQVTTSNKVTLTVTSSSPTPSPTPTPTPTTTPTPTATAAAFVFSASDWYWLIVVIVIIIVLFLIILAWYRRRRNLTVTVQNSQTLSPISGANVSASGPKPLSGTTGSNGQIVFSNVQSGNYTIKASATGYNSSIPVSVSVKNKTNYVIKLNSIASKTQETQTK